MPCPIVVVALMDCVVLFLPKFPSDLWLREIPRTWAHSTSEDEARPASVEPRCFAGCIREGVAIVDSNIPPTVGGLGIPRTRAPFNF